MHVFSGASCRLTQNCHAKIVPCQMPYRVSLPCCDRATHWRFIIYPNAAAMLYSMSEGDLGVAPYKFKPRALLRLWNVGTALSPLTLCCKYIITTMAERGQGGSYQLAVRVYKASRCQEDEKVMISMLHCLVCSRPSKRSWAKTTSEEASQEVA